MFKYVTPFTKWCNLLLTDNHIDGIDRGLQYGSGQIKDYKIDMCCFSAKHNFKDKGQQLVGSELE